MGKIPYDQETKDNTIDWWLPFYNTTLQLPATTEKNNKCAILGTILSSCLVTQRLNKLTPYEYCSFLRKPSSKRRYPCLNFWLKSRWEAWTGVELSKMTSAFFSVCRWEKIMKNKFKFCNSDRKEVSLWPFGIAWKPTREKFSLSIKQVKIFLFSWSDHT